MRNDDGNFWLDAWEPIPGYNVEHYIWEFSQASVVHKQLGIRPMRWQEYHQGRSLGKRGGRRGERGAGRGRDRRRCANPRSPEAQGPTPGERDCQNVRVWTRATEGSTPHMCYENKSFGQEGVYDDKTAALVYMDEITKMILAHICERKGATDRLIIEKIIEDIFEWDTLRWFQKVMGAMQTQKCPVLNSTASSRRTPRMIQGARQE